MAASDATVLDDSWSSHGMSPERALTEWRTWAPLDFEVSDETQFAGRWLKRGVGPLKLMSVEASPQRVLYQPVRRGPHYQLLYCARSATGFTARTGDDSFTIGQGEFALFNCDQPYELAFGAEHATITLLMPTAWLGRWLSDLPHAVRRSYSAADNWGAPLGSFLTAMAHEIDNAALPRAAIAEQVGSLIALAVGNGPTADSGHKSKLSQRIVRLIEAEYHDPGLDPGKIAASIGISKRYLHAVLAEKGMTFVETLRRVRLEQAAAFLTDRRFAGQRIAEISWRCGYPDPSYFARVFRGHFGVGPREWRAARLIPGGLPQ